MEKLGFQHLIPSTFGLANRNDPHHAEAVVALQDKSLIWRAARGVYLLEEASLAQLLADEGFLDVVPGYGAQRQDSAE